MDLYIIKATGKAPRFEGTQIAAKATAREIGGEWAPIVIPDRKEGMIACLNDLVGVVHRAASSAEIARSQLEYRRPQPRSDAMPNEAMGRDMSAGAVLARSDSPGLDVDGIVTTILESNGHALRRFAGAVALAFTKLGGE